jgi:release factor glutamine methyltransferase
MQLRQALNSAINRLTGERVPSPRMNAELLLMFTLDCDRAYLYGHPERELTADELRRYDEAIARRATGVPAQYITGHQEFWGMDLIVSPAVLIPRPETEHVVEAVLELVGCSSSSLKSSYHGGHRGSRRKTTDQGGPKTLRIVDVGTGSGTIALALAKELPLAEIYATDISEEALEVAAANAARHDLSSRIHFSQGDLFGALSAAALSEGAFDFVVSNPPYVGESEEEQVQLDVRKFEPRNAVFAGLTGLEVIERLIPQAHDALRPSGWLVMETSGTIAKGVRRLLADWDEVAIRKDLQGIERVAVARKSARW